MRVEVSEMESRSGFHGLWVKLTIERRGYHGGTRPKASDLPEDFRKALREWLDADD